MFEAAEVGRKVSKKDFEAREATLRTELLEAQRALRESDTATIIIVSGVEGAGKGAVVSRLNEWLDARGIQTSAFWEESDEERERPRFWRFWRRLPPRGTIGILFGSWYTRPIISHALGEIDDAQFQMELTRIRHFESMLAQDRALLIKLWFHISPEVQKKRLARDAKDGTKGMTNSLVKRFYKHYEAFARTSEQAIRATDTGECPWHLIEAADGRYRDLRAGTIALDSIRRQLEAEPAAPVAHSSAEKVADPPEASLTVLDRVDLESSLTREQYRKQLKAKRQELSALAWKARQAGRNIVAVFEGWDAAGKGGAIRRVTSALDARLYRVISVAAPTDEERAQHYLWRFWRHVPRAGYVTIYDRSWYGRVLVERVEGFARPDEWRRAYQEINEFELQLVEHGTLVLKFWIHISASEQLRRFRERQRIPWKQHKITEEDWRNRDQWDAYNHAVNDMVTHTSTQHAPWTLVAGNDKLFARVQVVDTLRERIASAF